MASGPSLKCPELRGIDSSDWPHLSDALRASPPCELRQAWRTQPQAELRSARAGVALISNEFVVRAELADDDIHTDADGANQRMWELGDTFEMFLQAEGVPYYMEFHVTPNNHRLQLRIPLPRPLRRPPEDMMVGGELFRSRVDIEHGSWRVLAVIPFESVGGRPKWFSFSRYDYTRNRGEPVLSSTSEHPRLDFHDRDAWGTIEYDPSPHPSPASGRGKLSPQLLSLPRKRKRGR